MQPVRSIVENKKLIACSKYIINIKTIINVEQIFKPFDESKIKSETMDQISLGC